MAYTDEQTGMRKCTQREVGATLAVGTGIVLVRGILVSGSTAEIALGVLLVGLLVLANGLRERSLVADLHTLVAWRGRGDADEQDRK